MKSKIAGFVLVSAVGIAAQSAEAACSAASIQGTFAAQFQGDYLFEGISSMGLGRIDFDGVNKIRLYGGRESAGGEVTALTGRGGYKVGSSCQGTATLKVFEGDVQISELSMDLVVSGSPANPLINVLIANPAETFTGQGVLTKIAF